MTDYLPVRIRGKAYRIHKRTNTKKRYIYVSDEEVLFIPSLPLLVVEPQTPRSAHQDKGVCAGITASQA